MNRVLVISLIMILAGVTGGVLVWRAASHHRRIMPAPIPRAVVPATTQASTSPASQPAAPIGYIDLIRAHDPRFPSTQPLGIPINLSDAAHVVIDAPAYICPRGDLWITHPDARPVSEQAKTFAKEQIHVVPDHVRYVRWPRRNQPLSDMMIIVEHADGTQSMQWNGQTLPLSRKYEFDDAIPWLESTVAPSAGGLGIFTPEAREIFIDAGSPGAPLFSIESNGLLVCSPDDDSLPFRIRPDFSRVELTSNDGWVTRIRQLVPLLDGSVLQIARGEGDKVDLRVTTLKATTVDEPEVVALVDQLSDSDRKIRDEAFAQLSRYGPGIWPTLAALEPVQPPAGRAALRRLLGERLKPTLAGMTPIDSELQLMARLRDGGAVFNAPKGIRAMSAADQEQFIRPAVLAVRPGRPIALLHPVLSQEISTQKLDIFAWGEEWIVSDETYGPRRFMANHFEMLLRAEDRSFRYFVGIDGRGRWVFRTSKESLSPTLLIDPTLPDPTPRLPVWQITVQGGSVGWDRHDWPATVRGGAWALHEGDWESVDENVNPITKALPTPATTQADGALCVGSDGTRYFGGQSDLRAITQTGKELTWPLPAQAVGQLSPILIEAGDRRLFLFNEAGRVLRLKPTLESAEPFVLEATFTDKIPSAEPTRIWRDRAGRIIIASEGYRLSILFPSGVIPQRIAMKMQRK